MLWRGARDVADANDTNCTQPAVLPLQEERWKEGGGGRRDTHQPSLSVSLEQIKKD